MAKLSLSKSDVVDLNSEYQSLSMSFSRAFVGLSQCCVRSVAILIIQSKYLWTLERLWWAWAHSLLFIKLFVVNNTLINDRPKNSIFSSVVLSGDLILIWLSVLAKRPSLSMIFISLKSLKETRPSQDLMISISFIVKKWNSPLIKLSKIATSLPYSLVKYNAVGRISFVHFSPENFSLLFKKI